MRRESGPFLAEGPRPELPTVGIEGDDHGPATQRIDVSGLRIGRRRRPAHAVGRHIALEDVRSVFPNHLAGIGVESHDALLEFGPAPGRVLDVHAVTHDDGSRAASERGPPEEVLAVDCPRFGKSDFRRGPIPMGSADLGPVAHGDLTSLRTREAGKKDEESEDNGGSFEHRVSRRSDSSKDAAPGVKYATDE